MRSGQSVGRITMSIDDINVRRASREDAGFLVPLINRAGEGIPHYAWTRMATPEQDPWDVGLARVESEKSGISYRRAWVAEVDGCNTGCLIVRRQPDVPASPNPELPPPFVPLEELENETAGTGYVYILATIREMRGRGVGTRLLSLADRYRGPNGMSLIVADINVRAKSLYERCGYTEVARRRMVKNGWQHSGSNWILMVKP